MAMEKLDVTKHNQQPFDMTYAEAVQIFIREIRQPVADELSWAEFVRVPFTHHVMILRQEKSLEGRAFYIHQCAI